MTAIDMNLFTIDPADPAVVRAAKLGSVAGIAYAEQAHAAGDTTIDLAAAAEHQAPGDLTDHQAEVYVDGFTLRGQQRWWELTD